MDDAYTAPLFFASWHGLVPLRRPVLDFSSASLPDAGHLADGSIVGFHFFIILHRRAPSRLGPIFFSGGAFSGTVRKRVFRFCFFAWFISS